MKSTTRQDRKFWNGGGGVMFLSFLGATAVSQSNSGKMTRIGGFGFLLWTLTQREMQASSFRE